MAIAAFPYGSFTGTIRSAHVMSNFDHIRDHYNSNAVETSGNQTIAGTKTFSAAVTLSLGGTVTAGGWTITAGGLTITAGGGTVTAGKFTTAASAAVAGAGFNLPHGVAPNTPANGDVWSTTAGVYAYINGATVGPLGQHSGTGTNGKVTRWTGTNALADASISDDGTYASHATQPRCYITVTGAVVATTVAAGIAFTDEALDVGGMWAVGNPSRFVVPAGAGGSYDVRFTGAYVNTQDGICNFRFKKNGTTDLGVSTQVGNFTTTLGGSDTRFVAMDAVFDLSAADYIEIMAADNGGDGTFTGAMAVRKVW